LNDTDYLAFVALPTGSQTTEMFVNVNPASNQLFGYPLPNPWNLFYVWTHGNKNGSSQFDLQSRMVGQDPYHGHVRTEEIPFSGTVYLDAAYENDYATTIQMETWDNKCQFYLRELFQNNLMGPNQKNLRLESGNSNRFRLSYRYRPAGSPPIALGPGDVAIYTQPNYTGDVWVLRQYSNVLSNFINAAGIAGNLFRQAQSVQFGPDSNGQTMGAIGYTGANSTGTSGAFAYNIPSLKKDPNPSVQALNQAMESIVIYPLEQFVTITKSCVNCDLSGFKFQSSGVSFKGVDLTGATLDGADLSGVDFSGANFTGASLRYVKTSGATNFSHANFSQATLDASDLRSANLAGAQFAHASLQHALLPAAR
jgi:uncharacterized protein YjbI with pentapeptide repeats